MARTKKRINVDLSERQIRQIDEEVAALHFKYPESALAKGMTRTGFVRLAVAYTIRSLREGTCYIHHPESNPQPDD